MAVHKVRSVVAQRLAVWTLLLFVCASASAQTVRAPAPILVQGAMVSETDRLVAGLDHPVLETIGTWSFWRGALDGYPVIVSLTNKGAANAAAATMLAVERFHPVAIINQGTAGGHDPALHVYDIVIGTRALNTGAFRSVFRPAGAGTAPTTWMPLDLLQEGSAVFGVHRLAGFEADPALLAVAHRVMGRYTRGRAVDGVIGSSDLWMDEIDLVAHLHETYGTTVEEMETAAAAQVSSMMTVPFIGIRILSDNITNGGTYEPKTGEACQEFVLTVVRAYGSTLPR